MKLSEMRELLKEYQEKYGDLEITVFHAGGSEFGDETAIQKRNFLALSEDPEQYRILRIRLWV